jgi:ABC-2 type transport system permease protein
MDFRKFALIVLKDVRSFFTDRAALVVRLMTPFVLTFVLAAAFGGMSSGDVPIKNIPVVVVNQDKGTSVVIMPMNFGQQLADALKNIRVKADDPDPLLKVDVLDDESQARAQVTQGKAAAAVIIPADFSNSLNPANASFGDAKIRLTVFRDAGNSTLADIVTSVVKQMLNGFASSMIAINAGTKVDPSAIAYAQNISQGVVQEVSQAPGTTSDNTAQNATPQNQGQGINLLQFVAPAMAIFFLNFAMAFGAVEIIEEKDNGTLQRMLISPTNRTTILAGKLGGNYVSGLLQIAALIVATSLIGPVMGIKSPVWGTNIPALIVVTLVVVAGATGFGTLIAALSRTRQQANVIVNAIMILMGIAGGTFFASTSSRPPMGLLSQLTVNYWANNAFSTLAQTGDLTAVLPNLAALLAVFVVGFGIGVYLFSRRLEA